MVRYRKGELNLYKSMNEIEIEKYINQFPENTEHIKKFLQAYKYNWVQKKWVKGSTI